MGFDVGFVPFNTDGWGPLSSDSHPLRSLLPLLRQARPHRRLDPRQQRRRRRLLPPRRRPPKFAPRWRSNQRPNQLPQRRDDEEVEAKRREQEKERARRVHRNSNNPNYYCKSSVDIQPEWTMLDQIPFSTFTKLSFAIPDPPEDLLVCGSLHFYDRLYDRVSPKNEKRLDRSNANAVRVTTTDDPVIRRLAADDKATVFATDAILSALMCAPRSVYSWILSFSVSGISYSWIRGMGRRLTCCPSMRPGNSPPARFKGRQ